MINWSRVGQAVDFYQDLGFTYREVPWVVSDVAVNFTLPEGRVARRCQTGALVGSAEQSFIQMLIDDTIEPGRYVAASPCFRDDEIDRLHQDTFFKVELIKLSKKPIDPLKIEWMAETALYFFRSLPGAEKSYLAKTEAGLDIELNGVELGSYGIRSLLGYHWVYGTGFADPRFHFATS